MSVETQIDFVIPWVDGNDPEWIKEKNAFSNVITENDDVRDIRFRDWETLKYWFRGVEEYAPWVNRIHFVTWGHVPKWLNTEHPKIHIVNHRDYSRRLIENALICSSTWRGESWTISI